MRLHLRILPLLLIALLPTVSKAGPILDLFSRRPKVDPTTRVPALITAITNDKEERVRLSSVEELPNYDPRQFPEIPTALIHALQNDASIAVRTAAISGLGRLRPANQESGYALEQAEANDVSPKVRTAATAALRTYKVLGYNAGKSADPKYNQSEEPPLAAPYDAMPKGKLGKPTTAPQGLVAPLREAPKPAVPVKSESRREGLLSLPVWLGGKEREKEVAPPKPPVVPRELKGETQPPPLAIAVPILPAPISPSPLAISAPPPVPIRTSTLPAVPPRDEVRGPSLEPPK